MKKAVCVFGLMCLVTNVTLADTIDFGIGKTLRFCYDTENEGPEFYRSNVKEIIINNKKFPNLKPAKLIIQSIEEDTEVINDSEVIDIAKYNTKNTENGKTINLTLKLKMVDERTCIF